MIGGAALLFGGLATFGIAIWTAQRETKSRLWAISNRMEGWIYGIGGLLTAMIGAAVLYDQIA
ncbi:MAG: hypothetical protein GC147_04365 [Porphyrobacter sp.]|nr:hypothetical protein [Porphyrobacter sp.]